MGWERGDIITQSPFSIPDIEDAQVSGSSRLCWLIIVWPPPLWWHYQDWCDSGDSQQRNALTHASGCHYSLFMGQRLLHLHANMTDSEGGRGWWSLYNVMLMLARSIYWLAVDIISWVLPMPVPVMHCPISDHTGAGARNYWPEPEPGEVKWGYCIQMTRDTGEAWPWSRDSICIVMSQ